MPGVTLSGIRLRDVLGHQSLWTRLLTVGVVTALSSGLALAIVWSNGTLMGTSGFLVAIIVAGLTVYRVDWGFNILILMALVFGQFEVPGFDTLTFRVSYFRNLKEIPYLPYFAGGDPNPFELHFLFVFSVWFTLLCIRRDAMLRPVSLAVPAATWLGWLAVGFAVGYQNGGEFLPALWELRALLYLGMLFFFVPQIVQTREQIRALVWMLIIGISFKALEGVFRYIWNGWSTLGYEAMLAHEDPILIGCLLLFLLGLLVFGGGRQQKIALIALLLPLALGFYVGQRRAGYGALIVSFMLFVVIVPHRHSLKMIKVVAPIIVILTAYVVVFWNSSSTLAGPIHQVRSGLDRDTEGEEVVKDYEYYSNLYRKIEDYDLAVTIQRSPVIGIGFGTKYDQPVQLAKLDFALRDYMAHNNVIWLLAKVGGVGFFIFWFFVYLLAFRGAYMMAQLQDPYLQSVCLLAVVAIINILAASYFDLHLVRYRTMIVLGSLMGIISSLETLHRTSTREEWQTGGYQLVGGSIWARAGH